MALVVTVCADCGQASAARILRCARCSSPDVRDEMRLGSGVVEAATQTSDCRFAVVALAANLRVLACGDIEAAVAIGDAVVVSQIDDGTFRVRHKAKQ